MAANSLVRVFRNAVSLTAGVGARLAMSFVFVILVARYLGVEGFGKYALAQQFFDLFLGLSAGGFVHLVTRELATRRDRASEILTSIVVLASVLSLVSCGMVVALTRLAGYEADTQAALLVVALSLPPSAIGLVLEGVFVAYERAEIVAFGTIVECALRVGLGSLALLYGYGLLAVMWSLVVARVLTTMLYVPLLRRADKSLCWRFRPEAVFQLVKHGNVFTAEYWISTLYSNMTVIALSLFHGEVAVGLFSAAARVYRLGTVAAKSFCTAVYPYMARLYEESREKYHTLCVDSIRCILILAIPGALGVSMFADRIVTLLFSSDFSGAIAAMRVLCWLWLFDCLNSFLSYALFARGKQVASLRVAIGKVLFTLTLPMWLIFRYQALGTAWACLVAEFAAFLLYAACTLDSTVIRRVLKYLPPIVLANVVLAAIFWTVRERSIPAILVSGALGYPALLAVCGRFPGIRVAI